MNVLEQIAAGVREDMSIRQKSVSQAALADVVAALPTSGAPGRDCVSLLRGTGGLNVIAEVKRASPAKGPLADIRDPASLAAEYEAGGAAAVSVLTERRRFLGSLDDLDLVSGRCGIPVLRKDFVLDAYQLWEARAHGADLVLLIVALLEQPQLAELVASAKEIGLTPLVEVHDEVEAGRALAAGARVIGVNSRDLRTLEVDRTAFARIAPAIPDTVVRIAESGVRGPGDAARFAALGADAVLVGEALVTGGNPREAVAALVAAGRRGAGGPAAR
ncbi:indole-3-glycerol phosphate synthase TrpC [Streptomyces sp. C11-1]|uniref:Indole-3-glycerol phosphate synthase n=1 Tax=Streptomyces durocortorensis TaxID=2811104 RepID=A0ABY9VZ04_9ACTN|nr:indole-3-glycerol phosphate synthase TrpC [Streptomyces durocortorensis]WNF28026.1 indole-3-glycerol phosphate synthase TrpC [Streptomyces durocortorensis]